MDKETGSNNKNTERSFLSCPLLLRLIALCRGLREMLRKLSIDRTSLFYSYCSYYCTLTELNKYVVEAMNVYSYYNISIHL